MLTRFRDRASRAGSPRPPTAASRRAAAPSRQRHRRRLGRRVQRPSCRVRRPRQPSASACASTPITSFNSPPNGKGRPASGQTSIEAKATLLSGHARRSRAAAATQRSEVSPRATFGIESAAAVRVCDIRRTPPPDENDIEWLIVPLGVRRFSLSRPSAFSRWLALQAPVRTTIPGSGGSRETRSGVASARSALRSR